MALNFTVSYTFSPGTTISSSQVNTNTTDVANVFTGLEAETKTLAKLKMDADPTIALEVATKQYVDHYSTWRRPVLKFGSITTIAIESGLDGTSGNVPMLFPDGSMRTETSTTRTTFNITRNAVLVTSGAQSGLTGATSEANNTWYALYAVKVTDSSTLWVTVGSTVLPLQANYATLNTAYGTNGWVYLGVIRNGDQFSVLADLLDFTMAGNLTFFKNTAGGNVISYAGMALGGSAGATSTTWTTSRGTAGGAIPNNISHVCVYWARAADGTSLYTIRDSSNTRAYGTGNNSTSRLAGQVWVSADEGLLLATVGSVALDMSLTGFVDGVLGVGSLPLL